jgi:hypothetical protein
MYPMEKILNGKATSTPSPKNIGDIAPAKKNNKMVIAVTKLARNKTNTSLSPVKKSFPTLIFFFFLLFLMQPIKQRLFI